MLRALAWLLVVGYFVAGLGYLGLRYLLWPNTGLWVPYVERVLVESVGRPLRIGPVRAGFEGLRPSLEVEGVEVLAADGTPGFSVDRIRATLSLSSLATGQLRFARLDIDAPSLRIERHAADRLSIGGVEVDLGGGAGAKDAGAADWLFAQRRIVLRGIDLELIDRVADRTLRLQGADLALGAVGRRHRLSIKVAQAPGIGAGVDAAIEIRRPAFSQLRDWRSWGGELHLSVAQAELPVLARFARESHAALLGEDSPSGPSFSRGRAAAQLWARFEGGAPVDALVRLAAVDAELELDDGPLALASVNADAELRRGGDGESTLRLRRLSVDGGEGLRLETVPGEMQALRFDRDGRLLGGELVLGRFDAGRLLGLAGRLPWPEAARARLAAVRLDGNVERLAIGWEADPADPAATPALRYRADARLDGLSFGLDAPPPARGELGLPSFRNLSGTVSLNEAGGTLAVAGRKAVLRFPGMFADPAVPLEALDARVSWRRLPADAQAPARVEVDVERVRFAAADAAGEVSGRYTSGGKGPGIVDLSGTLSRADATRVARYLPLKIPEGVRGWVARAIRAGRSDDVKFVLRGDLADFPYREPGTGLFRVEAALRDATLAYAPGWPAIEKIGGRLVFEGAGMDIDAQSGRLWGVALGRTRATIADFREELLRIEGGGEGPAQDMMRFIDESPLRNRIDDFTRGIAVSGAAKLALKLDIPLDDVDATRVAGAVRFEGNDVVVDPAVPPFSRVAGTLEFSERALALRGMSGGFLGGTVRVDGETPEAGRFALRASGSASAGGIRLLADNALTRALDGATTWRGTLDVRGQSVAMSLESDLSGLSSSLPAPFAKQAGERWPLRIETVPAAAPRGDPGARRDTLTIAMRDDVRLVFERERDSGARAMRVRRGVFALAAEPLMPAAGFAARLVAPRVDIDAWAAVLGPALEAESGDAGQAFSLLPSEVSLVARELRLAGKDLNEVVVGATRSGGFWRANVHSREVDGFFSWLAALPGQPIGTLTARFRKLEIPRGSGDEVASLLDRAPKQMPALDVAADDFVLNDRRLGRLALRAVNAGAEAAPVWRLESLSVENAGATLRASGDWRAPRGEQRRSMSLDFDLAIRDAGKLLEIYGFPGTMKAGAGSLTGRIAWAGSPFSIDYPSLGGDLALKLGKGDFLKTDPGIAKLIGVLNLQSLRRRLAFDFRDLFAEGFAFDEISASAKVSKGILRTDDFSMRGVTAQVRIAGEANLAAEKQNLVVEVRPELNAGLASLAYAALANPAIGLGTFLAQLLLREPLKDIFAWEYEVSGSWDDPVVSTKSRPTIETPPPGG
ncbi:TIGR02099 family protein [Burkholderiaceae bacterium FT117]|uniref:YhdP family protein n=1 Tax=Zeimonas sediminis TaxID=2944268 RepID=UPI002342F2FD|nr:YhdP family protein [Zeimonas sediminis]MCM5570648.1 TIGR02099 family protein [Zeimonas sediminis]